MEKRGAKLYDLEDRSLEFAIQIRLLCKKLPKAISNFEDAKQVIRSSGSIGANYIEANESLSKKDFLLRLRIAKKEAKETRYWLKILSATNEQISFEPMIKESTELMVILSAIIANSEKKKV